LGTFAPWRLCVKLFIFSHLLLPVKLHGQDPEASGQVAMPRAVARAARPQGRGHPARAWGGSGRSRDSGQDARYDTFSFSIPRPTLPRFVIGGGEKEDEGNRCAGKQSADPLRTLPSAPVIMSPHFRAKNLHGHFAKNQMQILRSDKEHRDSG